MIICSYYNATLYFYFNIFILWYLYMFIQCILIILPPLLLNLLSVPQLPTTTMSNPCCPYTHKCGATRWSMVDLSKPHLRKTSSPSPSIHQLLIAPWLEVEAHGASSIHVGISIPWMTEWTKWLEIAQVLCRESQLLWVHEYSSPVMIRRYHFPHIFPEFWLLGSVYPSTTFPEPKHSILPDYTFSVFLQ